MISNARSTYIENNRLVHDGDCVAFSFDIDTADAAVVEVFMFDGDTANFGLGTAEVKNGHVDTACFGITEAMGGGSGLYVPNWDIDSIWADEFDVSENYLATDSIYTGGVFTYVGTSTVDYKNVITAGDALQSMFFVILILFAVLYTFLKWVSK